MKHLILPLALVFLALNVSANETAKKHFEDFRAGKFTKMKLGAFSGWEMNSEDGKRYHRAFLHTQVSLIEKEGIDAVPIALKHLNHEHMHIRYIAAESLRRITKHRPIWYNFGTPGETFNGNKTWSQDAIKEWSGWYESNKTN